MKAIVLTQSGGVENLQPAEIPVASLADDEVLVQVKAISINPVDAFVRKDGRRADGSTYLQHVLKLKEGERPVILGWDISGIVMETGKEVTKFRKGDAVFGMVRFEGHGKAYAEYVAAPEGHLALKPAGISHEEAAAASLAALTAWQALHDYAKVRKGDKVLIHSGAGGVGHYAIQIAKYLGAYVIATSSSGNKDFVLQLGADEHIDYTQEKFEDVVAGMDVVLDSLPEAGHLDRSLAVLKPGGRLISLLTFFTEEGLVKKVKEKGVYTHRLGVTSDGEGMKAIAGLLEQGKLHSFISQTFDFDHIGDAHLSIETGRTKGKIVIKL